MVLRSQKRERLFAEPHNFFPLITLQTFQQNLLPWSVASLQITKRLFCNDLESVLLSVNFVSYKLSHYKHIKNYGVANNASES